MMTPPPTALLTAVSWLFTHQRRLCCIQVSIGDDAPAQRVSAFLDAAPLSSVSGALRSRSSRWFERVVAAHRDRVALVLLDHWLCEAISMAAALGDSAIVHWIVDYMGDRLPPPRALAVAATIGDIALVSQILAALPRVLKEADLAGSAMIAARRGHLHVLQAVIGAMEHPESNCRGILCAAVQGGYRACIKWLLSLSWVEPLMFAVCSEACDRDDAETVRWLAEQFPRGIQWSSTLLFVADGCTRVLQLILDDALPLKLSLGNYFTALHRACTVGSLEVVRMLCASRHGDPSVLTPSSVLIAASYGHRAVLEYLWHVSPNHNAWNDGTALLNAAVMSGRLEVVEWVEGNVPGTLGISGLQPDTVALAKNGCLGMLQYLHKQGISPNIFGASVAASTSGHLDVCQWLCQLRLDDASIDFLDLLVRQLSVLPLIIGERVGGDEKRRLEWQRFIAVSCWLWDQIGDDIRIKASEGSLDLLKLAAQHGVLRIIRDLHELKPETELSAALRAAATHGHLDVLRYLLANGASLGVPDINATVALQVCVTRGYLETLLLLHESEGRSWSSLVYQELETEATKANRYPMINRWLRDLWQTRS
ncbi:hypothetical protein PINS_up000814 [Pythium insidiosum]|nr:hypothetical protein PINS_up000814 [Pythium insidiosum]